MMNISVPQADQPVDIELQQLRLQSFQEDVITPLMSEEGLNDYQSKALAAMAVSTEITAVTDLPVRTGKSYLMGRIASKASEAGMSVTILSHRKHINSDHVDNLEDDGKNVVGIFDEEAYDPGVISVGALQKVARATDRAANDKVDVLLIDEGHRAIGDKTVSNLHRLYPNAVVRAFTGSPNYAEDRSVSDFFGNIEISRPITDAIEKGYVSPLRVLAYKTKAKIDLLDPGHEDFTTRELKNIREFKARNSAAVAMAKDLVAEGRQGLISTIPGGDLLHADILKKMLESETVSDQNGDERAVKAAVIKGSSGDADELLEAFEHGEYDVLLFCDKLVEGYTTERASFLLDTRPTTSIVHLTQILGRVLQPKDKEAIVVSFVDETTKKRQKTFYDVVGLDRSVQGVRLGETKNSHGSDAETDEDRYAVLRSLFAEDLVNMFQRNDKRKIHDLTVPSQREYVDPATMRARAEKRKNDRQQNALIKKWDNKLAREHGRTIDGKTHFTPDAPDYMGLPNDSSRAEQIGETYDGFPIMKVKEDAYAFDENETEDAVKSVEEFNKNAKLPARPLEDYNGFRNHADERGNDEVEEALLQLFTQQVTDSMLQTLDEREQEIIRRRYGLQLRDREREPLELVGESIGVTRERVRQIEQKALSKLRHPHISSIMGHDEYSPMETKTQAEIIADRQLSLEKRLQSLEINAPAILKARDQLVDDVVTLFSFGDWGAVLKSLGSFNTSGRLNMMTAVAKELNISMSFTELSQLAHEMAEIIDPYELFTKAEAFSDMQSREKGDYSYTYAHQVMIREHMTQLIAEALRISEEN